MEQHGSRFFMTFKFPDGRTQTVSVDRTVGSRRIEQYLTKQQGQYTRLPLWMVVGLLLEGLMAYKTPAYLQDGERRELFRLAHAHGTVLSLVLLAAALCGERFKDWKGFSFQYREAPVACLW